MKRNLVLLQRPSPQLPAALQPWLLATGSLSQQLAAHAGGLFRVEPRNEGFARPTRAEASKLKLNHSEYAWIREVALYGSDQSPWVLARSVIPLSTLAGKGRQLRYLKTRSLGSMLFTQTHNKQRVPRDIFLTAQGWTRCSIYTWNDRELLVQETFLNAFVDTL